MKKTHLLELWEARVEKILRLEAEALSEYKRFLKKYSHLIGGSRIQRIIRAIMRDECRHIEIAKKIRGIVVRSKHRHGQAAEGSRVGKSPHQKMIAATVPLTAPKQTRSPVQRFRKVKIRFDERRGI